MEIRKFFLAPRKIPKIISIVGCYVHYRYGHSLAIQWSTSYGWTRPVKGVKGRQKKQWWLKRSNSRRDSYISWFMNGSWTLPLITLDFQQTGFPLFCLPAPDPRLHFLTTIATRHIHCWDHACNMKSAAEHCQFTERAVLTVGNAKAWALLGAAALRHQVLDCKWSFPAIWMQYTRNGGVIQKTSSRRSVCPTRGAKSHDMREMRLQRVEVFSERLRANLKKDLHVNLGVQGVVC